MQIYTPCILDKDTYKLLSVQSVEQSFKQMQLLNQYKNYLWHNWVAIKRAVFNKHIQQSKCIASSPSMTAKSLIHKLQRIACRVTVASFSRPTVIIKKNNKKTKQKQTKTKTKQNKKTYEHVVAVG